MKSKSPIAASQSITNLSYQNYLKNIQNVQELQNLALRQFSRSKLFGVLSLDDKKKAYYAWSTYEDALLSLQDLSSGLVHLGVHPNQTLGLFSRNRPEFHHVSMAAVNQSMPLVPIHENISLDSFTQRMNECQVYILFCGASMLQRVFEYTPKCKYLTKVVVFDPFDGDMKIKGDQLGLDVIKFDHVLKLGQNHPRMEQIPTRDTIHSIFYTSGAHGPHKAIAVTHQNIVESVKAIANHITFHQDDLYMSTIPLSQVSSFVYELTMIASGVAIGFFHGSPSEIIQDMKVLQPTIMLTWPHFLESIVKEMKRKHDKMPKVINTIIQRVIHYKHMFDEPNTLYYRFLNRIFFENLKKMFGGNLRLIVSEGAVLRSSTHKIIQLCLDVPVLQSYGHVESTGIACMQTTENAPSGFIGFPYSCCKIALQAIPGILLKEFQGEICLKGPNIAMEFTRDANVSKESILDKNGWFHTGDVGEWKPDQPIGFIDHIDDMIIMSDKKMISSTHLEGIYVESDYVSNIFVYGDVNHHYLVAIVYVEDGQLLKLAKKVGIKKGTDLKEISEDSVVKDYLLNILDNIAGMAHLPLDHHLKNIFIIRSDFDVVDGLTQAHVLRRGVLKRVFHNEIHEMYRK